MKLTGTDRQAGRWTNGQDHVLSQADGLTKNLTKLETKLLFVKTLKGLYEKKLKQDLVFSVKLHSFLSAKILLVGDHPRDGR